MGAGMVIRLVPSDYDPAMQPGLARGVTAPEADQLVWTQGLYINWQPNGTQATLMNPANTLDDYTFNTGGTGMPVPGVMGAFGMAALNIPPTPANASYSSGITNIAPGMPVQAYQDPIYMFQGPLVGGFNPFSTARISSTRRPLHFAESRFSRPSIPTRRRSRSSITESVMDLTSA
jgi:hypothetical protein